MKTKKDNYSSGKKLPWHFDNEDGFSVYCTEWSDDGIREEIAGACYNVNPEDVVLLVFDGYTQTPKYEMRFAKENSVSENVPVAA